MDGLAQGLIGLAPIWPYVLLGVLLLLVGLALLIRATRQGTRTPQATGDETIRPSALSMRRSFVQGLRLLEANITGRARRYRMPWFLLLGEEEAGKTTLLAHTGLDRLLRTLPQPHV